jgi:omega-amidase
MKVHLVQSDVSWENPSANFAATESLLAAAAVAPGDLILLAEMFDTGFSFNVERTADQDGETLGFMRALAQRTGACVQGGRTILDQGGTGLGKNVMTAVGPDGRVLAEYIKVHPFQREAERFAPGRAVVTFPWGGQDLPLTVCPAICYDLRFPELFRRGLQRGAEIFTLGACWPEARAHHWRALLIARAIENQAYVAGVNRVGSDPALRYKGGSIVVGPRGDVLAEADDQPRVLSVEVDPAQVRGWRDAFSAWRDTRLI